MERYAAESMRRDQDRAIKNAIKSKMSVADIADAFELTEEEVIKVNLRLYPPTPRKSADDLKDARDEKRGR